MKRDLYLNLLDWKKSGTRKPLILKGVRQVGKTYTGGMPEVVTR